ncbi:hypothetical protein [Microbacterium sp. NPDC056569]|uniref:hypothetical protein n=1 Tax=Microbacterium sp. NPDC056569 TaxID=3345867 RepID=UPI00366CBC53
MPTSTARATSAPEPRDVLHERRAGAQALPLGEPLVSELPRRAARHLGRGAGDDQLERLPCLRRVGEQRQEFLVGESSDFGTAVAEQ